MSPCGILGRLPTTSLSLELYKEASKPYEATGIELHSQSFQLKMATFDDLLRRNE